LSVLDELVEASGLSPLFAKSAIKRAVDRCNVRLEKISSADVDRLVEELRRVIAIFAPTEVDAASARIRAMLSRRAA
jgi:hypothetical protein